MKKSVVLTSLPAFFGNSNTVFSDVKTTEQLFSTQIAPTVLQVLDRKLKDAEMKGNPIKVFKH
ncbi:hypothetical protein [Flavobacterium sp. RSP15]|uniref:hypothetical protein n=1 Tax=Flavobacterium sp. RSP15 TaxID=2497485 RepID=UPI000F82196D|nr:hypothetical protein [Flavobacterium sp. RSP15]RTY86258.1 hypothetical protein EKM00_11110 [Flavobacterium sp. RSP15]